MEKTLKKENVLNDFILMIENSWTYARLTEEEKERLKTVLFDDIRVEEALKGTCKQRRAILHAIYSTFLTAIGYNGFSWREE